MFFHKPRDLLKEYEKARLNVATNALNEKSNLQKIGSILQILILLPLIPIFILYKTFEYVHLIFFVIFGGLFLYFGITRIFVNSWTETALLSTIGTLLIVAPIAFVLDKD